MPLRKLHKTTLDMSMLLFSYSVDGRNIASDSACGHDQLNTEAQLFLLELPPHPPDLNVDWQYFTSAT